jgi:acyl-CoA reductase-like NAD-dependent aldehyde dehydrogenase
VNSTLLHYGSLIDGKEVTGSGRFTQEVYSPFNGESVGSIDYASLEDLEAAIASAYSDGKEEFALAIAKEAGKPIRDGRAEVDRSVQILTFAAEEAKQLSGELIHMDSAIGGENRIGMVRKRPIGVVAAITPFNFPLNLVLHKLAPAFAAGNTVVLKPSEKTPLTAIKFAKLFFEAGLPEGALNVVLGTGADLGEPLVTDPRVSKITFTGSSRVGLQIKKLAGLKKVTLELGSNSPNLVFEDTDLDVAVAGLVRGAFAFAGQVCISTQRIYVQSSIYQDFLDRYITLVKKLRVGNPLEEATDIGPLINEHEAIRTEEWVKEAQLQGAKIEIGGTRENSLFYPTVLSNVKPDMKVVCKEVFAPIVSIIPFETESEAIKLANDSDFGLQAGVFTNDINRAMRVAEALETGGVWINETSTYRQDNYPYGGVKQSGIGKEGVKYALKDMIETKFIGIKLG